MHSLIPRAKHDSMLTEGGSVMLLDSGLNGVAIGSTGCAMLKGPAPQGARDFARHCAFK